VERVDKQHREHPGSNTYSKAEQEAIILRAYEKRSSLAG